LQHANDDIESLIDLDLTLGWFVETWEHETTLVETRVLLAFQARASSFLVTKRVVVRYFVRN